MAKKIYDTAKPQERAVLVGVVTPGMKIEKSHESIDELEHYRTHFLKLA